MIRVSTGDVICEGNILWLVMGTRPSAEVAILTQLFAQKTFRTASFNQLHDKLVDRTCSHCAQLVKAGGRMLLTRYVSAPTTATQWKRHRHMWLDHVREHGWVDG